MQSPHIDIILEIAKFISWTVGEKGNLEIWEDTHGGASDWVRPSW